MILIYLYSNSLIDLINFELTNNFILFVIIYVLIRISAHDTDYFVLFAKSFQELQTVKKAPRTISEALFHTASVSKLPIMPDIEMPVWNYYFLLCDDSSM